MLLAALPGLAALTNGPVAARAPPRAVVLNLLPAPVLVGATALALAAPSVRVVGTGDCELVERLGVYKRQLQPGLHFLFPIIERVSFTATTREQVLDIPPQPAITSDNAPLTIDAVVFWRITEPELARYKVTQLDVAIKNLVITQLRSEIGKLTLDETFTARQSMNAALLRVLDEATDEWGVKIVRVEVQSITPNKEILTAMELQMSAERKKRALVLQSEGERESQVNKAQGEADAVRLQAEAEAEAVKLRAEAEAARLRLESEGSAAALGVLAGSAGGVDAAMQILMLSKYWETQGSLAASDNTKVLMFPSKATVPLSYEALREVVSNE